MHDASRSAIDDRVIAEIAVEVRADPRTIVRRLARLPVRGEVLAADIDAAIAARCGGNTAA